MIIKKKCVEISKDASEAVENTGLHAVSAIAELANCEVRLRYGSLLQLDEII